jgi:glycosyltransferase involved in cell wall biosynthesis
MRRIGLCMIVKNESRVILRCLESVRPVVDYALIEDTGSTDGTQAIIREYLNREGLPGEVFDEPWQDFAYNRSIALARLRENEDVDYALVMDADDVLVFENGFNSIEFKEGLTHGFYNVLLQSGPMEYCRPLICSNRLPFCYRGVLHEFLDEGVPDGCSSGMAVGLHVLERKEGVRSQDLDQYRKDAQLLEQALQTEEDPFLRSRYTFYLAQSYHDAGENEQALAAYLDRVKLGFSDEEVFVSWHVAGQIREHLGHDDCEIIGTYLKAYETCPTRAESLHSAARYCRVTGKNHQGYLISKHAITIPPPGSGMFFEPWAYKYGLLDELSICAYWTGRYAECLETCARILAQESLPEDVRVRVERNAGFALEKVASARTHDQALAGWQSGWQ